MKFIDEGFFKRNRNLVILALIIFLISAIAGAGISYVKAGNQLNMISNALHSANVTNSPTSGLSAIDLFTHNLSVDLITVIGGLLFSTVSLVVTIFNGVSIGSLFGFDLTFACSSILPHGIFEYAATVLALCIAFRLTKVEIAIVKNRNFKDTLKEHKTDFKDALLLFIIMIVLLVIAAFIEAHVTELVIRWVYGL